MLQAEAADEKPRQSSHELCILLCHVLTWMLCMCSGLLGKGLFGKASCTFPANALQLLYVLQVEAEDAEVRRALQAAEAEAVAGMPPPPVSLQELLPEQGAFRLQRVECTCAAHASLRRQLLARLQVLQDRLAADEQDEVCSPNRGMACWCDLPWKRR